MNRLDSDLTKEAEFFKSGVGKVASLAPVIDESKKEFAKLKTSDGKEHQIPILTSKIQVISNSRLGTMGEQHLDIRALYTQTGMFLFDPGYTITGACASSISYSNAEGKLFYRGYRIEELIEKSTYIEVCFLLLYGDLPNAHELEVF